VTAVSSFQTALRPFADTLSVLFREIDMHVRELSDDELETLRCQTLQPTDTNCSWAVFRVAPIVRGEVLSEQVRRRAQEATS